MTHSHYRRLVAYARANARAFAHWTLTGAWCPTLAERERFAWSRLPSNLRAMVLAPNEGE